MTTQTKKLTIDKLLELFKEDVLERGYPVSVYKFCKQAGIKESEFYNVVGSFKGLEKLFWSNQVEQTIEALHVDHAYETYGAREKVLAFFYTFIEHITDHRSFILVITESNRRPDQLHRLLSLCKPVFESYIKNILDTGMRSGEVMQRKFVDKFYTKGLWAEFVFILKFWIQDDSQGFQHTDEAIEKSVNLGFELLSRSPLDAMVDFGRFIYKTYRS